MKITVFPKKISKRDGIKFTGYVTKIDCQARYEDMTRINDCLDCGVESISIEEDGTLVVTIRYTGCDC